MTHVHCTIVCTTGQSDYSSFFDNAVKLEECLNKSLVSRLSKKPII